MVSSSVEDRLTALETEFRTELRHLATKADLAGLRTDLADLENRLFVRLSGLMALLVGMGTAVVVIVDRLWN